MTPEEVDANEGMEVRDTSTKVLVHILYRDGLSARVKMSQADDYGRYHEYITPIEYLREIKP